MPTYLVSICRNTSNTIDREVKWWELVTSFTHEWNQKSAEATVDVNRNAIFQTKLQKQVVRKIRQNDLYKNVFNARHRQSMSTIHRTTDISF